MSYPHLFLGRIKTVRIRRRSLFVGGHAREFVVLSIEGRRPIDLWTITLDPGPADPPECIEIIEEETE